MQSIVRTQPENLDDLTVQVALVRPGPIVGKAVNPYIKRRKLLREDPGYRVPFDHPLLEEPLRDTLGVIVYQDQVLEVAIAMAGFTPGEAESLRRAMSRKRSHQALDAHRERFCAGAKQNGVPEETALMVFEKVLGFSGFGFPKSHAADLVRRAPVGRDVLAQLVRAGALDPFSRDRRRLLWEIRLHRAPERGQLALALDGSPAPALPVLSDWDRMVADHETMSLSMGPHPMALLRPSLPGHIRTSRDLVTDPPGSRV